MGVGFAVLVFIGLLVVSVIVLPALAIAAMLAALNIAYNLVRIIFKIITFEWIRYP